MSWVTLLAIYLVVWWVLLYAVLPWGARPPAEPGLGHADSAPEHPRLLLKFVANTVISALLVGSFWVAVEAGWLSWKILFG